jgi:hypothetical protein
LDFVDPSRSKDLGKIFGCGDIKVKGTPTEIHSIFGALPKKREDPARPRGLFVYGGGRIITTTKEKKR